VDTLAGRLRELVAALAELQRQVEADKVDHLERMRQAARLQNDAVSARAHLDQLRRERERLSLRNAQAAEHLASLDLELETLTHADADLQTRLTVTRQTLTERTAERDQTRDHIDAQRHRLSDLRAQGSGLASRIEVLENLERSREGFGAGIREVLELLSAQALGGPPAGLADGVIGLVGDL